MPSDNTYKLLSVVDDEKEGESARVDDQAERTPRTRVRDRLLVTQSLVILCLMSGWLWTSYTFRRGATCQTVYSPAQDAIVYEAKLWHEGVWRRIPYTAEPSDEVDKAWSDLYNEFGISQIPKWQAQLLPNATLPIPADPEYHIVELSVFHQIHCLNTIRKALRPDYYVDPITGDLGNIKKENLRLHLGHCIDGIRQGLMCAGDISPIIWQWSDAANHAIINMDVPHSCRNYDMIVEWAKAHQIEHRFDPNVNLGMN